MPNGSRARLNFGLVEDLNEFYRNVRGIIGKHSETIVISFQPVTFIIIIPLFRHANFWLLLTTAAVEKPHNIQQFFFLHVFDVLSSVLLGVRCLIRSVVTGNAWVVCMPFRGGPVRANLLVRVDCQAYQPTHFTIWLYSYCRSGTLTVSAHQNTTLTPTAPSESNLYYRSVQAIELIHILYTSCLQRRHLKTTTWTCCTLLQSSHKQRYFLKWRILSSSLHFNSPIQWTWGNLPAGCLDNALLYCDSVSYAPTSEIIIMLYGLWGLRQMYH